MRRLLLPLLLLTAGCARYHASARPVMLPSGERGWMVRCRRDEASCLDVAASVCPRGYEVVSSRAYAATRATTFGQPPDTVYAEETFGSGSRLIRCTSTSALEVRSANGQMVDPE